MNYPRTRTRLCALGLCLLWSMTAAATPLTVLRIGYQKSSVNLLICRRLNLVETHFPGTRVQWVEFTAGPQLLEALGAGSLDFGMTGDTPPIFAQAAGRDILYLGQETPKPRSSAILVPTGSTVTSLTALRGKRVAFQKGSSAHYLVLRALEKAGLRLSEIEPIYLAPADARAAFERGSVDAWAIWDPYWAAAATGTRAHVLTTGEGLSDNVTFYESSRDFVKAHPEAIQPLFAALNEADEFVHTHRNEAAQLIASATGLDPQAAAKFLERRQDSPVRLMDSAGIANQQGIADAFARAGVIPARIEVSTAVWRGQSPPTVSTR